MKDWALWLLVTVLLTRALMSTDAYKACQQTALEIRHSCHSTLNDGCVCGDAP